ncbi:MAG: PQQ-binding-like beta-propeller repeat protein [Mycobacteriales bacterium]
MLTLTRMLAATALVAGCSSSGGTVAAPSPTPSLGLSSSPSPAPSPAPSPTPVQGQSLSGPAPAARSAALRLSTDWTTYGGSGARRSAAAGPNPSSPAVAWRSALDGRVYASPLVVHGRVIAATENGSLYALDGRNGHVVWRRHLAPPVRGSTLPCGNIDPLGITGTPVYDPATRLVFAVATQRGPMHVLYGVDAATGAVRLARRVDVAGMQPATHLQRAALLLSGRTVYVAYGGNYGDCGQYKGRVVAVPTSGRGALRSFAVPTAREAGIWAASGPALLPGGDLLVTTGNGAASGGRWDRSDSVLRLSPTLALKDGFAPRQWARENSVDADLGSMGPLLLPGDRRAIASGKGGNTFLVDVNRLGGVGGQKASLSGCRAFGGGAVLGSSVFLPCSGGLLQVVVRGDRLVRGWRASSSVVGSPLVVGTTVWSVQQDGTLYGLDAANGHRRARLAVGAATRFAKPAVSGNMLLIPTKAGITAVRLAYS